MRRGIGLLNWAARSERRTGKKRQNSLGVLPHRRRLVAEPLEDRRLLSVGLAGI